MSARTVASSQAAHTTSKKWVNLSARNDGKVVDNTARVVCPYCSGRILIKRANNQVKELSAE